MDDGVSVIIPTYNDAKVLPWAIESVLNQTHENLELIVVDDASKDKTEEVVKGYIKKDSRINYIKHEKNKERSAARNTGIKYATKEFIAFLDADDEWLPEKLEHQISYLREKGNEWVGVYCDRKLANQNENNKVLIPIGKNLPVEGGEEVIKSVLLGKVRDPGSNLILKTAIAKKIRGFDESMNRHEDYDFIIRMLKIGKLGYLDEKLSIIDKGKATPSAKNMEDGKLKLLHRSKDVIKKLEEKGYPIRSYQYAELSNYFLKEGNYTNGFQYLFKSINTMKACNYEILSIPLYKQFLSLFFFLIGIKRIIEDKS